MSLLAEMIASAITCIAGISALFISGRHIAATYFVGSVVITLFSIGAALLICRRLWQFLVCASLVVLSFIWATIYVHSL